MSGSNNKIYWDSCVLIAYLKDERCWSQDILHGIADVVSQVDANEVILVTSALTRVEVLSGTLPDGGKDRLQRLFLRSNVIAVAADNRVMDRAAAIREFYHPKGISVGTPDAIQLATAILYKADEMQTLDGKTRRGLIRFNGDVAGYNLRIALPHPRASLTPPPKSFGKIAGPLIPPYDRS